MKFGVFCQCFRIKIRLKIFDFPSPKILDWLFFTNESILQPFLISSKLSKFSVGLLFNIKD